MRVDGDLAKFIACAAIVEPYRQVGTLTTKDFSRWLAARDIKIAWRTLHHLWTLGVLQPIIVLEPARAASQVHKDRLVSVELGLSDNTFVDLGEDLSLGYKLAPQHEIPEHLATSLLWHPFQLWLIEWLIRILSINISPHIVLRGSEASTSRARDLAMQASQQLLEFAQDKQHHTFLRVLGLALAAEPLIHTEIDKVVKFRSKLEGYNESASSYHNWIDAQDGANLLATAGLSLEQAKTWHHDLSLRAQLIDPLEHFRDLFRHIDRRKRERLRGKALLAHALYDLAEVLRRYLERYHGQELLEENDAKYGPRGPLVKTRLYGVPRTADFNRTAFRRIAREFRACYALWASSVTRRRSSRMAKAGRWSPLSISGSRS